MKRTILALALLTAAPVYAQTAPIDLVERHYADRAAVRAAEVTQDASGKAVALEAVATLTALRDTINEMSIEIAALKAKVETLENVQLDSLRIVKPAQ